MRYTVAELAQALGVPSLGNADLCITRVAEPAHAGPEDLAIAMKPEYAETLHKGHAKVALLWSGADWQALGLEAAICLDRPRFGMSTISAMVDPGQGYEAGIHPSAIIDPSAELADDVSVGPFTVIGARAKIGAGSVVASHVTIARDVTVGEGSLIHPGVRVYSDVHIGARAILHGNVVIGGDGFSFVTPEESGVERARSSLGDQGEIKSQAWARIHSLGGVEIGDDVEIGANSTVDRGTVRATRVGSGTKIDNLVQIGHNVVVGQDCLLCAQAAVAGSSKIGRNTVIAGQAGVADNLVVGENVVIGAASAVLSNVPSGRAMLGYPAVKMDTHIESYKGLRRLPRLLKEFAELKKSVTKIGSTD